MSGRCPYIESMNNARIQALKSEIQEIKKSNRPEEVKALMIRTVRESLKAARR